jgi:hypothetical protein
MNSVIDNPSVQRFELEASGQLAVIEYQRADRILTLTHTYVPTELSGRGIGSALTQGTLDLIKSRGERIIPQCSFINAFIKRHPEYAELVAR